jgi:hypothetical protein
VTRPTAPDTAPAPITVRCVDRYAADLIPAFGFVFHVFDTRTRFTMYATAADAYRVGAEYTLTVTPGRAVVLPLTEDTASILRNVLTNAANRWREAITDARAGAVRPAESRTAEPGYVNVEPTSAGYQNLERVFTEELDRVERVLHLLDQALEPGAVREPGGRS